MGVEHPVWRVPLGALLAGRETAPPACPVRPGSTNFPLITPRATMLSRGPIE